MKTLYHYRNTLARETAHLVGAERAQLAAMLWDATCFVEHCPAAPPEAIALKLLTLHDGAERWVRILVAQAAIEAVLGQIAA